jgi:hypothetical protein
LMSWESSSTVMFEIASRISAFAIAMLLAPVRSRFKFSGIP